MKRLDNDNIESSYLDALLDPGSLRKVLIRAKKCVVNLSYDSVAFRGMSGTILGPSMALRLNKNMIMVRKKNAGSHSLKDVEGFSKSKKYIIVDDFIDSGKTVCEIITSIKKFSPKAKCIGILICCDSGLYSEFMKIDQFKKLCNYTWEEYFRPIS
jgi:orotate phosphoribosyltransferase-like protein